MDAALTSKPALRAAISALFTAPDAEFDAHFGALFAPDLEAVVNGEPFDFDRVKTNLRNLRAGPKLEVDVLDLVRSGNEYAWRHTVTGDLPDGKKLFVEIFVMGELDAEGRVVKQREGVRFA